MNIHAGAVALIVCYYDKAPETNKKLCSKPVLDFMFTGHAWGAFRAGALRFRPMNFKYLFSVAVSRLILSLDVREGALLQYTPRLVETCWTAQLDNLVLSISSTGACHAGRITRTYVDLALPMAPRVPQCDNCLLLIEPLA